MTDTLLKHISAYYNTVKQAQSEAAKKEALKDLLNRQYSNSPEVLKQIDRITLGAEKVVFNIPKAGNKKTGRADTLYNNIIIEFEKDLRRSGEHAKEQLAEYFLGSYHSGKEYNLTLIITDCITWRVYVPSLETFEKIETVQPHEVVLDELKGGDFTLTEHNGKDFFYYIDRFLFRSQKQKATLAYIEQDFGLQSQVFINTFNALKLHFNDVKQLGELQVSFEQWRKFLHIAYGIKDLPADIFLIHTYLSVFAKLLAYTVLTDDDFIDDKELEQIVHGDIFETLNVKNLTDNDFFYWVKSPRSFPVLKAAFREIAHQLGNYTFKDVDEDVLKGVYQELIDLDTRHALGEYYTPDWLCQKVVAELPIKQNQKVLDPSCGSGSFLRTVVDKLKAENPAITAEQLATQVYGIDIHPLSVQIAKTTLLVAIGKNLIRNARKPISLNVFLSNTILVPDGVDNLFGGDFKVSIDSEKHIVSTNVLNDMQMFDEAMNVADTLADLVIGKQAHNTETFFNNLKKSYPQGAFTNADIESFYKIYLALKKVKEAGRDSIWKFILQNTYKPYFLREQFDFVVGNPPWFTYSSVKNEEYQNELYQLADKYEVLPGSRANMPHLEIAAIFLAHASAYFLKQGGQLAFVLPRSFMSADQHENTRSGKAKGFTITQIWDMQGVNNLFRVPCCVFFTQRNGKSDYKKGIAGQLLSGNIKKHNSSYAEVMQGSGLKSQATTFYYATLGKSSAFSITEQKGKNKVSHYKKLFKQGATIVPRNFYFVELAQDAPPDWDERLISVKTSAESIAQAKKPWKEIEMHGAIDSRFFFRTAIAKNILPFALHHPELIVLPAEVDINNRLQLLTHEEILRQGYYHSAKWFSEVENYWNTYKTEKNKKINSVDYVNWQNKLTVQDLDKNHLVLYNSSAKDANATVVNREDIDLTFIIESTTYWIATNNLNEANYLTVILNSDKTNEIIKSFQAKGLFGERHVHKKILDVPFPRYAESNKTHQQLAALGQSCHQLTQEFLATQNLPAHLNPRDLGRLRTQIKKHLQPQLTEIDECVGKILK